MYSSRFVPAIDKNKEIHGNKSGFARNWVCGPNHEIRNQQVPGYTGHIKGLISENLFAYSYGNTTAKAIGKKHPIGHNVEPRERFLSQNTSQYKAKNFRRFIEHPTMKPRKDYDDYARFINDTYSTEKEKMISGTVVNESARGGFPRLTIHCTLLKHKQDSDRAPELTALLLEDLKWRRIWVPH